MKKIVLLFLLILASQTNLFSAFTVTQIVTDEFPYVKVNFVATQPNGQKFTDLKLEDFVVTENGVNMSPTLELNCQDLEEKAELSILLVLDRSGSMETNPEDGVRRWDWVVEGCRKFLETLEFNGRTKVAVSGFSFDARLIADFTNDREMLIDTIEKTIPFGPTFYNPPFIDSEFNAVDLLSSQPADMNRICIFLTDGLPEPGETNKTQEIFQAMQNANIQVYTITLLMPMTSNLSRIANETGGKSFEVRKREELTEIYELIAIESQSRQLCELKWLSHYGCNEVSRERDVTIDFLRDLEPVPKDRSYIAPENSIAKLEPANGGLLSFGNPEVGVPTVATASFTVVNGPFTYKGHNFTPPTFYKLNEVRINGNIANINDTAFPDDTIEVDIEFTQQTEKEYRQALFTLDGVFCPGYMNLAGGFSKVVLVNPHTSVYSPCDGVDIQWAGLDESTPVNLYYSTNNGSTWNVIVKNVTGGFYKWNPNFTSNNIKVKVEREARQFYRWVHQGKNNFDAFATGIDMDPDEVFIYTSGYFQETLDFLGNTKVSKGGTDVYVAKLDRDGFPQWMITGGTSMNDSIAGVVVSNDNFIFTAGTTFKGLQIGTNTPFIKHPDVSYGFLSKISPDGGVLKTVVFGADQNASSNLWVRGVRYEETANRIAIVGNYNGRVDFPNGLSLQNNGSFIAYYDLDLNFLNAQRIGYNLADYQQFSYTDSDENKYSIHTFDPTITFDGQTLTTQDAKDIAIECFGKVQASEDISNGTFALQRPKLEFTNIQADLGDVIVGDFGSRVFTTLLKNTGNLPVQPKSTSMVGEINGEFSFQSTLPDYIAPGEEVQIEFSFAPKKLGARTSTFTIVSECASPINLELIGNGTCKGESDPLVNVGKKTIGIRSRIVVNDIFNNPTSQVIRITPTITNDPNSEFEIFALDQNGDEQNTINVPAFSKASFVVYFTPNVEGIRTATIDFGVTSACDNTTSELQGEGINSAIVGSAPELENRIRTVNKAKITLENLSDLNSRISNLQIVNDPNNYFKLINVNNSYDINGNESIEIDYEFTPLTEGEFTANLQFELANGNNDNTTELKGTGLFPQIEAEFICATNAVQSQTSQATIRLTNKSNLMAVEVFSITSNSNDYKFTNGSNVSGNIQIPINSFRDVTIDFTPSLGGSIQYDFDILADASIGNLVDDAFAADTTLPKLQGDCTASPNTNQDNYTFGNILVCDKPGSYLYTIENTSSSVLTINSADIVITPNDGIFSVNMPATLNIPVGASEQVEIIFTPQLPQLYNASISFKNNLNVDYTLNVNGTGVYIDLNATTTKTDLEPGIANKDIMSFNANIPRLSSETNNTNWNLSQVIINVKYNNKVVHFIDEKIADKTNGDLVWTLERVSFGEFNLVGVGSLPTAYNKALVTIEYYLQLSDEFKSDVNYEIFVENCNAGDSDPITLELSEFCLRDFRVFDYAGTDTELGQIAPNPISINLVVPYTLSFDGPVKIEIRNSIGDLISTPVNSIQKAGINNFLLDVESLSNGLYFINYETMNKTITTKFIVNK